MEAEKDLLANLKRYSSNDVSEKNLLMAMALHEDSNAPATFFTQAMSYAKSGTLAAQSLHSRKLSARCPLTAQDLG